MSAARDPLANPTPLIRRVYSYAAYTLGEGPDAEDATSETFERALRYRDSYDPAKGTPIAWLIGIARRSLGPRAHEPADGPPDELLDLPSTEELEVEAVNRLDLYRAVSRLAERDRELVALRYGADLTAGQIAELLGMRTNAVEVALHRVHARLRAELAWQPGAAADTSFGTPRKGLGTADGI